MHACCFCSQIETPAPLGSSNAAKRLFARCCYGGALASMTTTGIVSFNHPQRGK